MTNKINFLQGNQDTFKNDNIQDQNKLEYLQVYFEELLNTSNINFLLGSGTSVDAIPTMEKMQEIVEEEIKKDEEIKIEYKKLKTGDKKNLEQILGYLYSHQEYLEASNKDDDNTTTHKLIKLIKKTIFTQINIDCSKDDNNDNNIKNTRDNYKEFYQKISRRNIDLARPNIFTTNNDLFNETAMDNLNINYNNGFSGGLKKYFNPAQFNSVLSQKVDLNLERYQPMENLVNLYKLHGSVNWVQDENSSNKFFNIQETNPTQEINSTDNNKVLTLPYSIKTNSKFRFSVH